MHNLWILAENLVLMECSISNSLLSSTSYPVYASDANRSASCFITVSHCVVFTVLVTIPQHYWFEPGVHRLTNFSASLSTRYYMYVANSHNNVTGQACKQAGTMNYRKRRSTGQFTECNWHCLNLVFFSFTFIISKLNPMTIRCFNPLESSSSTKANNLP